MQTFPPTPALGPFKFEAERFGLFVLEVTDYAIYMLSPEGIINSWNAGAQRFKQYTADEIVGQHFSRFYTEEDKQNNLPAKALKTAIEEGKFEAEGWLVRKDGTQFWASVVIDSIRDAEGKLLGFTKITRDITDRKKASEALHVSEERFRLLVQGVTDHAIYMLSPTGEITNWNSGAKRIKGYEDHEIIGTHFSRFYTDEDREKGLPMKALEIAKNSETYESEGWRLRKDGSKFWAHVVISPIKNELGELIGFAKVTRDVTEKRETEKALQKAQEALFHSQKMEAIGRLTGGVAHDFNNLLSVVVSGIEILRFTEKSDVAVKTLESMERAVSRGAALTQQLLSFSRQQPLKQKKHDLNRIINSFESVLRRANKVFVNFEIKLAASVPPVLIDATQFEASLLNLIVNAEDAIADNGNIILQTNTVALNQNEINQLPAGHYVKVSVIDTGEGIPEEILSSVIEPFFTTKPMGKGTGLGLSQVYGLVQQSSGDLKIISTLGKGTEISLYFPALVDDTADGIPKNIHKALVVDDQPDVLNMAAEVFRTLGYEVLSANNAEEALNILKRNPDIEVLFSDVVMPGMSGIDLGQKVRELFPNIKILLVSGYTEPALKSKNANLDDFQFICKPYRITDIVKNLQI